MNEKELSVSQIYFFCLEFGPNSQLLSVTNDWVERLESAGFEVIVVATHIRKNLREKKSSEIELGGGSYKAKCLALARLLKVLISIARNRRRSLVFYHMNHKALAFQGLALKLLGVHQILWYSHAKKDLWLNVANNFADLILTTSSIAYPLNHGSILPLGQAVNNEKFNYIQRKFDQTDSTFQIVSVGRVSRSKNLEKIVLALNNLDVFKKCIIHFCGPVYDMQYAKHLESLVERSNIELVFMGSTPYQEIPAILANFDFYFTGTNKAIDKAAIEAAMSGLIVISDNIELLKSLDQKTFYGSHKKGGPSIEEQLAFILRASPDILKKMSKNASTLARQKFSIDNAIDIFSRHLGLRK